jgi:hypothetical protein
LSVVLTDANGDVVMNAADCTGGGGGPTHDYAPYGLDVNASNPDTVILATSPFSYYPLTAATTGTDVANGHTATGSSGTLTFPAVPMSSKKTVGESCRLTNGGSISFPSPVADLSSPSTAWAAVMLVQVDAFDSGAGGSPPFGMFNWTAAAGSPPKMILSLSSAGRLYGLVDSNFSRTPAIESREVFFSLGEPHVYLLNAPVAAAGEAGRLIEVWLDGVLVATFSNVGDGTAGNEFTIGRTADHFFGAMNLTFSNLGTWNRVLTNTEIETITEALADAAIFAGAWTP